MKYKCCAKLARMWFFSTLALLSSGCSAIHETAPSSEPQLPMTAQGCELTYRDTSTFSGYLGRGWQTPESANKLIIVSDPQPFYTFSGESAWRLPMASLARTLELQRQGSAYVPMIINGDITHYGHGDQRKAFRDQIVGYSANRPGPLLLPGLGNHDYEINIDDCANNGCARDAVCDHILWTKSIASSTTGMNFDYQYSSDTRRHTGSLSYSLDIGKLHIVQLNLEPTYTTRFSTGGGTIISPGEKTHFDITSSMSWLEADLMAAKGRGQYTIINMHTPNQWQNEGVRTGKFKQLVEANRVIGVFAGHYHSLLGRQAGYSIGKVPVFFSGSMPQKNWLRLLFDWDKKILQVDAYANVDHVQEYKYNMDTFQDLTPPPPPKPVRVTLFSEKNFRGSSCTMELEANSRKDIGRECRSMADKVGISMKVTDFGYAGKSLCLSKVYEFGYSRCYLGDYRGDFEVADFSWPGELPPGLNRIPMGNDTGYNLLISSD